MQRFLLIVMTTIVVLPAVATSWTVEPLFHRDLKLAAKDYLSWARVDDEYHWAPQLCRTPNPGRAYASASADQATHGRKLYSLFAKDHKGYLRLSDEPAKPGQIIVKQSWVPEEVTGDLAEAIKKRNYTRSKEIVITARGSKTGDDKSTVTDHFLPYAVQGEKVYKAAKQSDLFIMMKMESDTPMTDHGWVYGTVTADGKTVTSAGRVASCMKCHADAKHDRLFGPTPAP